MFTVMLMNLLDLNLRIWILIFGLVVKLKSMERSTEMMDNDTAIKPYTKGE